VLIVTSGRDELPRNPVHGFDDDILTLARPTQPPLPSPTGPDKLALLWPAHPDLHSK